MKRNPYEDMKALYPATPPAFSRRIDSAILALPERGARWKLPVPAVAGYAAAACVALALVLSGAIIPVSLLGGAKAQPSASSYLSSGPEATASFPAWQDTRYSVAPAATVAIPTAEPLPQLPVVENAKSPTSADGWQVAAVDGGVTWYYHPAGHKLAFAADGKTTAIALDLNSGQSIDTYSFVPEQNGQSLAFTIHQIGGEKMWGEDTVWLVTRDGKKMVVPDDIRWVDANRNLVRFNMADASMNVIKDYSSLNSFEIFARFPGGDIYLLEITLNSTDGAVSLQLDRRTGVYAFLVKRDENKALTTSSYFIYEITEDNNGKVILSFGGRRYQTELRNNRFEFFHFPTRQSGIRNSQRALLVYQDDPSRTLWELDIITGKVTAVATGCVAADWTDDKTYWYSTSADSAAVLKKEASGLGTVESNLSLSMSAYPIPEDTSSEPSKPAMEFWVEIVNGTNTTITIPETIPCSLRVHSGNKVIWSLGPDYPLSSSSDITKKTKDGANMNATEGPITLEPGETLNFYTKEIPLGDMDECIVEGSFYDINNIYYDHSKATDTIPTGAGITGRLMDDGRLFVTVDNQSRATLMLSQDANGNCYVPNVRYRLLKGNEVIDNGKVQLDINGDGFAVIGNSIFEMAASGESSITNVPPGNSLALKGEEIIQKIASLAPGEYTLQCCMDTYQQNGALPWGYASGYYFDVPFTKK